MMSRWMVAGACALALAMTSVPAVLGIEAAPGQQDAKAPPQVNLNTATATELESLPGVGPAMAQRILEYREKNGGFRKIEELMNVRGVGEASFLKLKPQIIVTPQRTAER